MNMVMGMVTKITRNGYANLLVSPKSKSVFPSSSSSFLKNPLHQRSIISEYSQKIRKRSAVLKNVNNVVNQNKNATNLVAKRFYNSDNAKRRWYQDPTKLITLGFVGCWVAIPVYYLNSETVPYTNRGQFVVFPNYLEKKYGEFIFEWRKSHKYKGKILDSHHPESIRVNKIWKDIIGGLMRNKIQTSELCNWEIIVVDEPNIVNAMASHGGKIVIYTGMLNHFKTDAEIAIVIGHEVGHIVARHGAETKSVILWVAAILTAFIPNIFKEKTLYFFLSLFRALGDFVMPIICIYLVAPVILMFFCFRWQEFEADYIGMLISACAGYDPRIAPQVYVELEKISPSFSVTHSVYEKVHGYSPFASVLNVFETHPLGKRRAEILSQPKVMEEALAIYTEALDDTDSE